MNFTTKIPISKSAHPIDYHSKIVSLGSCFAVNMAENSHLGEEVQQLFVV